MIRTSSTIFAALLLLGGTAHAQGIDLSSGGPVEVTAKGTFEVHDAAQEVIAEGDARAVRGTTTVLADRLIARYRKRSTPAGTPAAANAGNEVYRLEAHGHVRIVTPTDEALGDDAIYDLDQAALVMTGKALKLTTPTGMMTARDTLEYWSQQHMAVGRGNAVVITNDARRISADVMGAYTDPDSKAAPSANAKTANANTSSDVDGAGKLRRVDAFGNVEVRTSSDVVRGDNGLYLPETGQGRVVGHVRITRADNQLNGPAADFDMKTGVARIVALQGSRVEGLLVPNSTKTETTPPAKPAVAP